MKNRKLVATVVMGAVLLMGTAGFVAADELLTLRAAVQRAITENTRIKLAQLSLQKAERSYDNTASELDRLGRLFDLNLIPADSPQEEEAMRAMFVGREAAEVERELAERQKQDEETKLAYEVQQQYLNVIRAREHKALLEGNLERAKDLLRLAEVAYKAGTAARSDVMRAEAHVAGIEAMLFGAGSGVKIAEAALNMTMGNALEKPVLLAGELSLPGVGELDSLERATNRALANRIELVMARGRLTVADRMMVYARNRYAPNDFNYSMAELSLEEARLGLKATEDGIRFDVYAAQEKVAGGEKQLAARQKSMELAAESYRLAKLRYELGVATQGEMVDAMLALSEQETHLLNAKFDYYLDYLNWRLKTGLPVN